MDFRKKTIRDVDVAGKIVLVRVDYNVPMKDGVIVEDMRIRASLPTIEYLRGQGAAKIVLISHLGRPEGEYKKEFSLAPCAERLSQLLPDVKVTFVSDVKGGEVERALAELPEGGILMLENLRFSPDEERNSESYASEIVASTGAQLFVQDGFAVIHRAHASTDAIAKQLPAVAGFLVEKEVSNLESALTNPAHPVLVIIGGAKVDDKAPLIEKFLPIADTIFVGGKIAADGYVASDAKIVVADDFAQNAEGAKLDIGPNSTAKLVDCINNAKTIVWNGTMGYVEEPEFAKASLAAAEAMGKNTEALTIVGGGDTAGYVESVIAGRDDLKFSLISTGGGASLELLSGKKLPGLEVLLDK